MRIFYPDASREAFRGLESLILEFFG